MEIEVKDKIDIACKNFKDVFNNIHNRKFDSLDDWLYQSSLCFKRENNYFMRKFYPRFDYGTIVKVDFGIGMGSELSGLHFAIVLEKYDSTKNSVITVLPLTSKNKKYYLSLGILLNEEFIERSNNCLFNSEDINVIFCNSVENELKWINEMFNYYKQHDVNSYAMINQIVTVSKDKLISPKNKYDIIGRVKCCKKAMLLVSLEILKKYTNIEIA